MIDTTRLQSSSLFAGFANLSIAIGSIDIPAGQVIPGFTFLPFTFDIKRANQQSLSQVLFQVVGPTTLNFSPFDSNQWKSVNSGWASWYRPDDAFFDLHTDVLYAGDSLRLRVSYFNEGSVPLTVNTAITVNAKAYFFKYPWE